MVNFPKSDSHVWVAPWLVVGLGVLLLGIAVVNFRHELRALAVFWPPVAALLINFGLGSGLIYAGWWLRSTDFQPMERWRIVGWCYSGATILVVISGLTIVIRVVEGHIVAEPILDVLITTGAGGLAGLLIGVRTVRADREARDAQQARETLAFLNRMLRHEVLNGVNIISGQASYCLEQVNGEVEERLDVIIDRSENLSDLIQTIRPAARAFTAEGTLQEVNLSDTLNQRVESNQVTYPDAEVKADIPARVYVRANEALGHIFENLLANAVEHNDSANPRVTIDVELTEVHARVAVADNGPGIADNRKDEIFKTKPQSEHGFGLYLVRTLVTRYGGEVWVEDNHPRGSVFTVELPRVAPGRPTNGQLALS